MIVCRLPRLPTLHYGISLHNAKLHYVKHQSIKKQHFLFIGVQIFEYLYSFIGTHTVLSGNMV